MKNIYDSNYEEFIISIEVTNVVSKEILTAKLEIDRVLGFNIEDIMEMMNVYSYSSDFSLRCTRKIKCDYFTPRELYKKDCLTSDFVIKVDKDKTFEECIRNYFVANFSNFTNEEKTHALCFLSKYCMENDELKEFIDKNKTLVKTTNNIDN